MTDNWTPNRRPFQQRRKPKKTKMPTKDYAIVHEPDGKIVVHTASCPDVRMKANLGYPVATLLDCQEEPSKTLKRHSCLEDK